MNLNEFIKDNFNFLMENCRFMTINHLEEVVLEEDVLRMVKKICDKKVKEDTLTYNNSIYNPHSFELILHKQLETGVYNKNIINEHYEKIHWDRLVRNQSPYLPENTIRDFLKYFNPEELIYWQNLPEDLIEDNLELFKNNWSFISRQDLSFAFIKKYEENISWYSLVNYTTLSENVLVEYFDKFIEDEWFYKKNDICKYPELIEKYKDVINWRYICQNSSFTKNLLLKYEDYIYWVEKSIYNADVDFFDKELFHKVCWSDYFNAMNSRLRVIESDYDFLREKEIVVDVLEKYLDLYKNIKNEYSTLFGGDVEVFIKNNGLSLIKHNSNFEELKLPLFGKTYPMGYDDYEIRELSDDEFSLNEKQIKVLNDFARYYVDKDDISHLHKTHNYSADDYLPF